MARKLWLVVAAFLVAVGAGIGSEPLAAQPRGFEDWLHFDSRIGAGWTAVAIPGDPLAARVVRQEDDVGTPRHRILSLRARASSAYDVAISEVAAVLGEKLTTSAEILVVNYDGDDTRARGAIAKAERDGFDLILSMGSEATAWLWKNYRNGRLPVVSVCSKDPVMLAQAKNYTDGTGTNFALTSLNLPADVQMAYALELMPRLRNLAILVDSQNLSAVETQAAPIAAQARSRGIRVLDLNVQDPNHAAEELSQLVDKAVESMRLNDINLENSLFLITGSTAVFNEMKTINAHSSRVPILSLVPETVHAGIDTAVLSVGVSFRSNAHLAAIYAASIMDGRTVPGAMKVGVVTPPDIAINFSRARAIGLRIPFSFFESANTIYNYEDKPVRTINASQD